MPLVARRFWRSAARAADSVLQQSSRCEQVTLSSLSYAIDMAIGGTLFRRLDDYAQVLPDGADVIEDPCSGMLVVRNPYATRRRLAVG